MSDSLLEIRNLTKRYSENTVLRDLSFTVRRGEVIVVLGPSGCGKSTLLRTFNRMYELYNEQRAEGEIWLDGENIVTKTEGVDRLRSKVGMVFQRPTPFPMSIYDNIAYGVRFCLLYTSPSPRDA